MVLGVRCNWAQSTEKSGSLVHHGSASGTPIPSLAPNDMRNLTLALMFSAPILGAQSLGEPRAMKKVEVLHYTGSAGLWHPVFEEGLEIAGVVLHFEVVGKTCVIRHGKQELKRVSKLPASVDLKLPRGAALRSYKLRLRIDSAGWVQLASAMAVRCKVGKDSAWVVDVDLDGVFLEHDEDALLHADSGTAGPFSGEIWFHRHGLRVTGEQKPVAKAIADARKKPEAALCVLNHYRQVAGFPAVGLDLELAKGCALHSAYVGKNRNSKFNWHTQDPANPHYTKAGAAVARRSLFSFGGSYINGVIGNLDIVYHRRPLLAPNLGAVGMGGLEPAEGEKGARSGALGVLALRRGQSSAPLSLGDGYPWPARGQTGVPTGFTGQELPMPLAKGTSSSGRGYPVTYLFQSAQQITDATLQLFETKGKRGAKPVKGFSFGPGNVIPDDGSTYSYAYRNNSGICHFIAAQQLRPNSRYTARCSYQCAGEKKVVEWSFVTGRGAVHLRH